MTDRDTLSALFRSLGATDPDSWASSQDNEGIPQLHRFLFLRAAWARVADAQNTDWIDNQMAHAARNPKDPAAATGRALARLVAQGADRADIAQLVRGMQTDLLFSLCGLLDGNDSDDPRVADVNWRLVTADQDGRPTGELITGLHESVADTDPTGQS
jgi:hypothetical protein